MTNNSTNNADRFTGFAGLYDAARPSMPKYPIEVITNYLGKNPDIVVDLGCGTGLSTFVWQGFCNLVVGVEPSVDMLAVAQKKQRDGVLFKQAFAQDTGLENSFADAVVCSQSFHWMEPTQTLKEINRILKTNGVFAAIDCDWPPVCNWQAEKAYEDLFNQVSHIEEKEGFDRFTRWEKSRHLSNMQNSGYFRYTREIVFSNQEKCTATRFIDLALSQGGIQSILKVQPELIIPFLDQFRETIHSTYHDDEFTIAFCYRMRVGVK